MRSNLEAKILQVRTSLINVQAWCCRERNIREIFSMYDVSFAKLSDRFFKTTSWPPVHMIADLVDGDHVFCLLYKVCAGSWPLWSSYCEHNS